METRKIQQVGGSSFSLVLPKKWVNSVNLKNKTEVRLVAKKHGPLLVMPKLLPAQLIKKLDVHNLSAVETGQEIIALYINGYEEISIVAPNLSVEQKHRAKAMAAKLSGMEVSEESAQSLTLKNLLDPEKINLAEILQKMFSMSLMMLTDAFRAFADFKPSLAKDVIERDQEIDKLYFLILRVYHSMLTDKISEEQVNTDVLTVDYFQNLSGQLERVADHAVKIASLIERGNAKLKPNLQKPLSNLYEATTENLKAAEHCAFHVDKNQAHQLLGQLKRHAEKRQALYDEILRANQSAAMIACDSLDRINGYVANMAEYALDKSLT